jgi:hypothetical protein
LIDILDDVCCLILQVLPTFAIIGQGRSRFRWFLPACELSLDMRHPFLGAMQRLGNGGVQFAEDVFVISHDGLITKALSQGKSSLEDGESGIRESNSSHSLGKAGHNRYTNPANLPLD